MTRRWTAKTFQDCAENAKREEGGKRERQPVTTNVKYLKNLSQPNRLKGSKNIYILYINMNIYIYIFIYISSLLFLHFLCPYFLKNQITQIPEQERVMVQPNNIMEITCDFEEETKPFL